MTDSASKIARLRDRVERLRGLCKSAVGALRDQDAYEIASEIEALIGDMEPPLEQLLGRGADNEKGTSMSELSQPNSFLSEILSAEEIPLNKLAYFRGRLSNRIHELVLEEFMRLESEGKINRAVLAGRIGKEPAQITSWLGSAGNWTIDTLSDLMLGMGLEPSLSSINLAAQDEIDLYVPDWREQASEIVQLRARIAQLEEVLREIRSWRRSAVGLERTPNTDTETLGYRIDAALDERAARHSVVCTQPLAGKKVRR